MSNIMLWKLIPVHDETFYKSKSLGETKGLVGCFDFYIFFLLIQATVKQVSAKNLLPDYEEDKAQRVVITFQCNLNALPTAPFEKNSL